jgi:glycosyltransferase involved in cell wall biosynthesis
MSYRTPSRYDTLAGPIGIRLTKLHESAVSCGLGLAGWLAEVALFGPVWGSCLRFVVVRLVGRRLRSLRGPFDAAFYVRQFAGARRRGVARSPLLHYALIGWREGRSPAPGFDPVFYVQANPALGRARDPLLHYVTVGAANSAARNDLEVTDQANSWHKGRDAVLTIHHGRGGGSSHFLEIFEEGLRQKGNNVLRLRAVYGAPALGVIEDCGHGAGKKIPTETFDLAAGRSQLAEFCRHRKVKRVLVNHLVDRPAAMTRWITELCQRLKCPYDVVLHDYYALCPRINLVTGQGKFCGVASEQVCVSCVDQHGSDVIQVDPRTFRRDNLAFLSRAETVFVPSQDMASRLAPHLPRNLRLWLPEQDDALPAERLPCLAPEAPLDIAILGGLNVPKGLHVVASLARAARLKDAGLRFTLIGPASAPSLLTREGVSITGPYAPDDVDRLIDQAAPHVVFLPAIWPETWSFVLTIALRRGLPVVAFDIGAPAERLRGLARGKLLDAGLAERPDDLLAAFLELRGLWQRK